MSGTAYVPSPRRGPGWVAAVALVVLGALAVPALGAVAVSVGPAAVPVATALAAVPLVVVVATILWVDRWEPEPWPALAVAFGWGATVSVLVALVLNSGAQVVLLAVGADEAQALGWTATVVAPVVEESVKGLGVVLLFLGWRRFFDGPVDGVVYAATVAAGFAFVENILYFGRAVADSALLADGGATVVSVFVMRAVLSPFAHVLFTACVGLAVGLTARRRGGAWVPAAAVGLVAATLLHALWNGSATLGVGGGFWGLYLVVQVPVFLGVVGLVVWLRHRESRVVRDRLAEYVPAGWFSPAEVAMLSSLRWRRRARRWARGVGGPGAARTMRRFQLAATHLAYQRQRVRLERADLRVRQDEAVLLGELARVRRDLASRVPV